MRLAQGCELTSVEATIVPVFGVDCRDRVAILIDDKANPEGCRAAVTGPMSAPHSVSAPAIEKRHDHVSMRVSDRSGWDFVVGARGIVRH